MNKLVLITSIFSASIALAQKPAKSAPAASPAPSYSSSYSSRGDAEISGNLGFQRGAANFGVAYTKMNGDYGFGGYFFMQTNKDKSSVPVVNQVMSAGGIAKIYLTEKNGKFSAYLAPGVGVHMIKDVVDDKGKKADKTIIGPLMKLGGQVRMSPALSVGIERTDISNWFDEDAAASYEHWSALVTFEM